MPIARLIDGNASARGLLRQRLASEWRGEISTLETQPVLIEDKGKDNRFGMRPSTHLYVIWDQWQPLTPQERSEIIMDAYEDTHELADVTRVTVAMGLTDTEAQAAGIHWAAEIATHDI